MRENIQYDHSKLNLFGRWSGTVVKYFLLMLFAAIIILPLLLGAHVGFQNDYGNHGFAFLVPEAIQL